MSVIAYSIQLCSGSFLFTWWVGAVHFEWNMVRNRPWWNRQFTNSFRRVCSAARVWNTQVDLSPGWWRDTNRTSCNSALAYCRGGTVHYPDLAPLSRQIRLIPYFSKGNWHPQYIKGQGSQTHPFAPPPIKSRFSEVIWWTHTDRTCFWVFDTRGWSAN